MDYYVGRKLPYYITQQIACWQLRSTTEHYVPSAGDYVDKIMGDFTMVLLELSELRSLKS